MVLKLLATMVLGVVLTTPGKCGHLITPINDTEFAVNAENETDNDCWDASLSIYKYGQEVSAVNLDCIGSYTFSVDIQSKDCARNYPQKNCSSHRVELSFNGMILFEQQIDDSGVSGFHETISGNFGNLGIENLGTPGVLSFEVRLFAVCMYIGGNYNYIEQVDFGHIQLSFPIVSSYNETGQVYEVSRWDFSIPAEIEEIPCDLENTSGKCCSGEFRHELVQQTTYSVTQQADETFSVVPTINLTYGPVELSLPYSQSFSVITANDFTSSAILSDVQVLEHTPGYCIHPGFSFVKNAYVTEIYGSSCEGPDILLEVAETQFIPRSVELTAQCFYEYNPTSPCPGGPPPTPDIEKGINGGGNILFAGNCEGYINLILPDYEGLTVEWLGPNDFISYDFFLEDISIGTYHYIIYNECCESVEGEVQLCDNLEEGPWSYDPSTGKYCQVLSCNDTGDGFGSNCEVINCITPSNTIIEYNSTGCIEQHFHDGEFLGEVSLGPPVREIEFDETAGTCRERLFCAGEEVEENTAFPSYGFWNYDQFQQACTRAVFCFGEEMVEQEEVEEPEIVEEYNEFTGMCDKVVYCGGNPFVQPSSFPFSSSPWTWDQWGGCTKDIQCSINSGTTTIEGSESFSDWSYNTFNGQCEANVYCNGENNSVAVYSEFPNSQTPWTWVIGNPTDQQCVKTIYCGLSNDLIYVYDTPDFIPSGNTCPGYPNVTQYDVYCDGTWIDTSCLQDDDEEDRQHKAPFQYPAIEVNILPNPFDDYIMVSINNDDPNAYHYQLFSPVGGLVSSGPLEKGNINTIGMAQGVYLLRLLNAEDVPVAKYRLLKM